MNRTDWKNLPFAYQKTDYNVRCYFRNGQWGEMETCSSETINLHMSATVLHYGQAVFEGMKAFIGKDGKIRVFRWEENAKRMNFSAEGIMMPPIPIDLFKKAIIKAIKLNHRFIPPYESGASLYIRPLLIGSGAMLGVKPADEYLFVVFVTPVGPYLKGGFLPVDLVITREYDRAAPLGTGQFKVAGNYAASLRAGDQAKKMGFASVLYLDPKEKKYIDECGPANFFAIKNNTYITPDSTSILGSITNLSLMVLAKDIGMNVEKRKVPIDELETFEEVGACGTAAVISPISSIYDPDFDRTYEYCPDGKPGENCIKLYNQLTSIQYGNIPDKYGWITEVEL